MCCERYPGVCSALENRKRGTSRRKWRNSLERERERGGSAMAILLARRNEGQKLTADVERDALVSPRRIPLGCYVRDAQVGSWTALPKIAMSDTTSVK